MISTAIDQNEPFAQLAQKNKVERYIDEARLSLVEIRFWHRGHLEHHSEREQQQHRCNKGRVDPRKPAGEELADTG
ncbi:MAG: hypothetical protein GX970_08000 [Phyllobacteriaceae bacterium]|nr:hypothetical protein [Phyllobacteriaceae bacterium]